MSSCSLGATTLFRTLQFLCFFWYFCCWPETSHPCMQFSNIWAKCVCIFQRYEQAPCTVWPGCENQRTSDDPPGVLLHCGVEGPQVGWLKQVDCRCLARSMRSQLGFWGQNKSYGVLVFVRWGVSFYEIMTPGTFMCACSAKGVYVKKSCTVIPYSGPRGNKAEMCRKWGLIAACPSETWRLFIATSHQLDLLLHPLAKRSNVHAVSCFPDLVLACNMNCAHVHVFGWFISITEQWHSFLLHFLYRCTVSNEKPFVPEGGLQWSAWIQAETGQMRSVRRKWHDLPRCVWYLHAQESPVRLQSCGNITPRSLQHQHHRNDAKQELPRYVALHRRASFLICRVNVLYLRHKDVVTPMHAAVWPRSNPLCG